MSTKELSPSRIVQNPRLWPSSFSQPVTSQQTCIRTYIFKDGTKVEKFLDFVKKTLPNSKVELKKNDDGSTSVSLTTISFQANNDYTFITYITYYNTYCQTNCKQYEASKFQSCLKRCYCINNCSSRSCVLKC